MNRYDEKDTAFFDRRTCNDRRVFADPDYSGMERRVSIDRRRRIERRKNKRFPLKNFAFVKLLSHSDEDLGQILDISNGGLSLRYFVDNDKPRDFSKLGIFFSEGDVAIDMIPFKTVSDTQLPEGESFGPINFRRSGVQFERLTNQQISQLDHFIRSHVLGKA